MLLKSNRKPLPSMRKASRNNHGYTLQTVIVIAILVSAAVGASVVLYRAINSNTDVRSITDLAGSNAPSRPHSFVVEKTSASVGATPRDVPSANIRWSPPLYTGHPQLEGTPASLLYKIEYGCADPADSTEISELADVTLDNIPDPDNDPMDSTPGDGLDETRLDIDGPQTMYSDSTVLSLPTRILEELFPSSSPPSNVYCILEAQAYTCSNAQTADCANPGDNASLTGDDDALTGQEIYSLEGGPIRFELTRGPSEVQNIATTLPYRTATQNRVDISWETPEYTGVGEAYLYEIQWAQRKSTDAETNFEEASFMPAGTICTVGNIYSHEFTLNSDTTDLENELAVDFRITPYAVTQAAANAAVPANSYICPSSDNIAGTHTDLIGVELLESSPTTVTPPTLTLSIPASENISSTTTDEQKRAVLDNRFIRVEMSWGAVTNASSYELQWSRADGSGTTNSRVSPTTDPVTDPVTATLNLENDRAYNFNLTVNLLDNEPVSTNLCAIILHSQRTPIPDLEVFPIGEGLRIRIAPHNQARFCDSQIVALTAMAAPATQHYKVQVYDPTSCTGTYPDQQCSDVYFRCLNFDSNRAAEEVVVTGLTAGNTYEVEVIAGHTCDETAKTIGFTIPGSNPNRYGYPSASVTQQATPLVASTAPLAPPSLTVTYDPSTQWTASWGVVSGATGYIFTLDHDSTVSTDMTRYAYTPTSRDASFSTPSGSTPSGSFTCSKSSNTVVTCSKIPDDSDTSTDFKVTVQAVSPTGISTTTSDRGTHP